MRACGRDARADVSIPSSTVSRHHAKITIRDGEATVVDLKSKNGTRVAGREAVEPIPLVDGVVIEIGRVEMIYRCPSAQGETETAQRNRT